MILVQGSTVKYAIEIKYTAVPKLTKGNTHAFNAIQAQQQFVIVPKGDRYHITEKTEVISLWEFVMLLKTNEY